MTAGASIPPVKHHIIRMFVNTDAVTTDWSIGREVLSAFCETDERLMPEHLYQWETCIGEFETVEQCKDSWAWIAEVRANGSKHEFPLGLGWRRKKAVRYQAEIKHSGNNALGRWNGGDLSVYAAPHKTVDWLPVFRRACNALTPTFGLLHYFTPIEDAGRPGTAEGYFSGGIIPRKGMPERIANIGWATFFGGEFAKDVKAEQIAEAGFAIEKVGDGYLARITDNINDVADNYPHFSKQRAELKKLFPDDFFLVKDEPIFP
ncbi:hypothetical protein ACVMIX_007367 [Rhizobium leguminosarum]|uniref:hypothetical protein n=1 Tax=Rhizobium leguminosarum TaxID=384 RepID=UPI0024B36779|nr:hypothetical protein [Rhizobium leguminosarum]WHO83805.1 hypothetical protein QMO81_006731 [Rhizobium leguminosarum]